MLLQHDSPFYKERYDANAGPLIRFIADFYDHSAIGIAADCGVDQSYLWNNWLYNSMKEDWEEGKYFLLPTTEMPDMWRYKLLETGRSLYLYTGELKPLEIKTKKACPFGFG